MPNISNQNDNTAFILEKGFHTKREQNTTGDKTIILGDKITEYT
jgi:hypothetical protein